MSYADPFADNGLNDDMPRGGIAERMYRRLHESGSASSLAAAPSAKQKSFSKPPVALICYLCGQQFGTASLEIHQKQCYSKRLLQWERGDPSTRGPRPMLSNTPTNHQINDGVEAKPFAGMSAKQAEEFNNNQFQEFQEKSLVPCENCGRTFFPDRLQVHLRSCKPGSSAKRVTRKSVEPASPNFSPSMPSRNEIKGYQTREKSGAVDLEFNEFISQRTKQDANRDVAESLDGSDCGEGGPQLVSGADLSRPHTANSAEGGHSSSSPAGGASSQISSPQIFRANGPSIPQLHLNNRSDPQSPLISDEFDGNSSFADTRGGCDDILDDKDSPHERPEESEATPAFASQKPKQPTFVDRPLDLSHVQSRFKMGVKDSLERCQYCNRTFAPDRLSRHEDVCIEKKNVRSGGPIGTTPRVGVAGKQIENTLKPTSAVGVARSGAVTSRTSGSGYGVSRSTDGPLTTRGPATANKIIRPANASSRTQSPSIGRQASRSPPPTQKGLPESRGNGVSSTSTSRSVPTKIIQPPAINRLATPPNAIPHAQAPPSEEIRPKFCTECGTRLYSATQKFCGECGHRIDTI